MTKDETTWQRRNLQREERLEVGLGKGRPGFHYKPQLPGHHTHLLTWRLLSSPQPGICLL